MSCFLRLCNSSLAEYAEKWYRLKYWNVSDRRGYFPLLIFSICGRLKHDKNLPIFGLRLMIDMFKIADDAIYGSVLCGKKGRRAPRDMVKYMLAVYTFQS